ncbi:hypothetical protein M9Y10_040271 [Tritrichomonas musculus]|uniref:Uncharacterized protein n=1 Tax=Tritrichomonas musculus TaxID=1915356 RepID=A0ABR2GQJ7_9EUKA
MAEILKQVVNVKDLSIYEIYSQSGEANPHVHRFIASTPQSRSICNDPNVAGTRYTTRLCEACSAIFKNYDFGLVERETVVLNILRGALNFGLRDALANGLGWWRHNTSFISAQRARDDNNPENWHIEENSYKKVYFPSRASIVLGDVVATGTSLRYGLNQVLDVAQKQKTQLSNIVFFTYGGKQSEVIFTELDKKCRQLFPEYKQTFVIYLEGRFEVPDANSKLTIRFTGTDLVRGGSLMAPEFVQSQYEKPTYPLERCTIYDAGSRAFWIPEYLEDVVDYWKQTLELANKGTTFQALLAERFPELDASKFGNVDLKDLCTKHLAELDNTFHH